MCRSKGMAIRGHKEGAHAVGRMSVSEPFDGICESGGDTPLSLTARCLLIPYPIKYLMSEVGGICLSDTGMK